MTPVQPPPRPDDAIDAPPPIFRTWRRAYWALFLSLITYVAVFWVITRIYA